MIEEREPFRLTEAQPRGPRYAIRSCGSGEMEWVVGSTVQLTIMASGHGAQPQAVSVQLTNLNFLRASHTYEFHGCVPETTQSVTGIYTPRAQHLGTIRAS